MLITQSRLTLCGPMDCSLPGSSVIFPRQEYWSGLPFPSPDDLPDPGIKPSSPTFQADSLPSEPPDCSLQGLLWCMKYISLPLRTKVLISSDAGNACPDIIVSNSSEIVQVFPGGASSKESTCQCRRRGFHPWFGKIPWRKKWQPSPVSCWENLIDREVWQATVHGVTKESDNLTYQKHCNLTSASAQFCFLNSLTEVMLQSTY